ncbi:MAG: hypothetical protein ABIR81_06260, partial [Ginsengibacter sp.]
TGGFSNLTLARPKYYESHCHLLTDGNRQAAIILWPWTLMILKQRAIPINNITIEDKLEVERRPGPDIIGGSINSTYLFKSLTRSI